MSLFDWQALRRNWLVSVSGLVVSVGISGASFIAFPTGYITTSQVVLLPPISQPIPDSSGTENPYLGLTGLQSMASVVSSAMMDDDTAKILKQAGVTNYSVQYNPVSPGPILESQVTEPSPEKADRAIAALDRQVPLAVARLQDEASISPHSFVTARVIASPTVPARSIKTQLRVAALVLVVGFVLTLLVTSVVDAWRARRTSSKASEPSGGQQHYSDATLPDISVYGNLAREPEFTPTNPNNVSGERYR